MPCLKTSCNDSKRLGYTQAQAAEALGVSRATYQDLSAGKSRNTGRPVEIDRRTELACAAIEAGIQGLALPPLAPR
ncbi:helix-turn-helix domain-containing protein [Candidatus Dactylopiibacterium carminicum]|uniref:helix-turn-helix domain-containing protein n=1 Tax=Candidatus Dactylopiibacterium carminicum TaxID=857335 RepID=UPI001140DAAE